LLEKLQQIPDPRGRQGRRFSLSAMLATVVCGILCGARGYEAIAGWIAAQDPKVWYWLGYWRRPPCANAFRDLLLALNPLDLEQAVREWIGAIQGDVTEDGPLTAVAMDGKSLCGTLPNCWNGGADTGASKIACTGFAMCSSAKTPVASASATLPTC
jgi:hypothetical protein